MLQSLCIKTNQEPILNYLLNKWKEENVVLSRNKFKVYENIIVHYSSKEEDEYFYDLVADTLTDVIIEFYESHLVKTILNINYFYFSDNEKIKIYKEVLKQLSPYTISNKATIFLAILNYVKENKVMILDGFVYFCLKDYIATLDDIVDSCVDNFLVEREYNEFVNLLKIYIESKKSEIDVIHLLYHKQEASLLDKYHNNIIIDMNSLNAKYLSDISFSKNDYVLNTLLTKIPQKLYIHSMDEKDEFIHTLELIFANRVHFCKSCNLCEKYKVTRKESKI